MANHSVSVTVNGSKEYLDVPSNMTLLQMLRERLALTGSKNGCTAGECGACTVLMNGEPVNSCLVLAVEADGAEVVTVENFGAGDIVEIKRPDGKSFMVPMNAEAVPQWDSERLVVSDAFAA